MGDDAERGGLASGLGPAPPLSPEGAPGHASPALEVERDASGDAGAAIPCPNCRYDLRGLAEARCPECGMRLEVVGGAELEIGGPAYRASLGGLMFTGIIGLLGLLSALGVSDDVLFFGVWVAMAAIGVRLWMRYGRTFMRRQYPDVRRGIVIVCWLGWLVALMVFALVFRW